MSDHGLHQDRETGLAEDVNPERLEGELGPDGEVTIEAIDEEEEEYR